MATKKQMQELDCKYNEAVEMCAEMADKYAAAVEDLVILRQSYINLNEQFIQSIEDTVLIEKALENRNEENRELKRVIVQKCLEELK